MAAIAGLELWQWWQAARRSAEAASIPINEADWLLQEVSGLDRLALHLQSFKQWPTVELSVSLSELQDLWQQRVQARVPVQYLAGKVHWRQFTLAVSPAVLIPRPETEYSIDLAAAAVARSGDFSLAEGSWVDLGTGSGAIAIGLADAFPQAAVYATDVSAAALAVAQQNAATLGFASRIHFHQGTWWEALPTELHGQLSGMVSNPPYIPSALLPGLQPEVAHHEPHLALDGGGDGLACVQQLIDNAHQFLRPGGIWLVELMAGQAQTVADLLRQAGGYQAIQIHLDLAGIERFVSAHFLA